jgi:putative hemolysin
MMVAWAGLAAAFLAIGFFAIAELALLSTSRIRLRGWVRRTMEGEAWVQATDVVERPYRLIAPILVGRALAVTAAALLAAQLAAAEFEIRPLGSAAVAALLLTPPIYLLDALIGAMTRARAYQLFPAVSLVLRLSSWVFRPLVLAADAVAALLRTVSGRPAQSAAAGRQVLEAILDESERAGVIESAECEIIAGVFEFGQTTIAAVMTPVEEMVVAPAGSRAGEISALIRESGYSRIPLHGRRDPRRIVGMVHVFDLYQLDPAERPHPRPVVMTHPEAPCDELLVEMKRRRCHLAIVAEAKRAVGMVTMEDLVEELVGEIRDEHDARAEGRERPLVVDARTPIAEINAKHDMDLPTDGADTVEGLLTAELGRVPQTGEELRLREWAVEVLDATQGRVRRVRLRRRGAGSARGNRTTG